MIKKLYIEETEDTPEIILDYENEVFQISGRSLPENVNLIFSQVLEWFNAYFEDPLIETIFSINLEYYNSATAKKLVELFFLLEKNFEKNCNIKIIWYHKRNDITIQKKGKELLSIFKTPFDVVSL